ncbi:23S rRNA (guanine(745)-N(1))-methyltransferase [Vibrio neptunius]|uniref:23S rRNA (Guanine(745)-N(1))-methyltransferase n=1 Tax=Vibrio neptunius TaxID=170651 RepID=A0ABS2ZX51_9VIBR|nr:23S rRNA (guanine(745)-N(1))-methyltransferase [Vibrio neptunius]MBN3492082.1 23S rRNA (guanine(745)-N(1))-methyltransferase [Vibrio neptunius]MBN3514579.1 23S rRNA (guanine(745)-N(1))-methyltransferase [Vibrio neptunius]MBN3549295.1 23S rRNA (guanine(745)-N(1))-methyltransferase [Vibrio neptunius]MBN3576820.1 23S rRNA (guanine(745)-N(1))-methyltransferase [Vibrio neptunius]MCH9870484.1 23S rRNA (guanine(745)-N(1))-methyltransferase [Vibrio neptunius]
MSYTCPLCHQSLSLIGHTFRCENNHAFDLAKEGYVNLMPVQHKRSKDPGDNKEMMQARRRFLEKDYYRPLKDKVAQVCAQYLESTQHQLLDIGCGEGYYTTEVARQLSVQHPKAVTYGIDISKVAIRYASKRHTNCSFSVASSTRLPFSDGSLDAVLRIYAPCKPQELARVVNHNGVVITVTPAARHLYQLREHLYQDVRLHSEEPENIDGFVLQDSLKLSYTMPLQDGDADDLLQMTPFAWKASEELRDSLKSSKLFECEADFMIRIYRKQPN